MSSHASIRGSIRFIGNSPVLYGPDDKLLSSLGVLVNEWQVQEATQVAVRFLVLGKWYSGRTSRDSCKVYLKPAKASIPVKFELY